MSLRRDKANLLMHAHVLRASAPGSFFVRVTSGVFIFVAGKTDDYRAVLFSNMATLADDVVAFVREAQLHLNCKDAEVKLIGFDDELNIASAALRKAGIELTVTVRRFMAFEVTYDLRLRRLRVSTNDRIKVLIVDDSPTMRKLLRHLIEADDAFTICGEAALPSEVEPLLRSQHPDVMTLDINMPEMSGVDLLRKLMPTFRIPTVLISSLNKEESPLVLEGLEAGAVDYLQKPESHELAKMGHNLAMRLRIAANANVMAPVAAPRKAVARAMRLGEKSAVSLIAIGSSTGGTEALKRILTRLPAEIPPIVIAQHLPGTFSSAFAERLKTLCAFPVSEGQDGETLSYGHVYVAPGGRQMRVLPGRSGLRISVDDDAAGSLHKPSINNLFHSVAQHANGPVVGIILTGMGADGAEGMVAMKNAGARTIAQDEASCVIFGMPAEAIKAGAVDFVVPLDEVPDLLMRLLANLKP